MMLRLALTLATFLVALTSCSGPLTQTRTGNTGSLSLQFTPPVGRTVVPDLAPWLAAIDAITVVATPAGGGASVTKSVKGAGAALGSVIIGDLAAGDWNLAVTAKVAGATVATGSAGPLTVEQGTPTAAQAIVLVPSSSGTGDLQLEVSFPDSAGITAVTGSLKAHGGKAFPLTLGSVVSVAGSNPARSALTVSAQALPVGAYDLDLTFDEPSGQRTYRQAVNIYRGRTSDQTLDSSGKLQPGWYLGNDFFGTSTYLANVNLLREATTTPVENQAFSSPTRDYNLVTMASSFRVDVTLAYAGQIVEYWNTDLSTPAWTTLVAGTPSPQLALGTLTLRVSTPGGAKGYYTFQVQQGSGLWVAGASAPAIQFQTPLTGQTAFERDQPMVITASSGASGTWAWLFDGALVPGKTAAVFSATPSSLGASLGPHVITALLTTNGFTWARQFSLTVVGPADAILSLRAQQTEIHMAGGSLWVYGSVDPLETNPQNLLTLTQTDGDVTDLWYAVDTFSSPIHLTGASVLAPFTIDAAQSQLDVGIHTVIVQVRFADGRLAGAMVPFELKTRGSSSGLLTLSLPVQCVPLAWASGDPGTGFSSQWWVNEGQPITLTLGLAAQGLGSDTLLRYNFRGTWFTATPDNLNVSLSTTGLPRGSYTLTVQLWSGDTPAQRVLRGTIGVVIYYYGGTPN